MQLTKSHWALQKKLKELGVEMDCQEECMNGTIVVQEGQPSSDTSDSTEKTIETNDG
jgi:hypothetical protein